MYNTKNICRRCLLAETGEAELIRSLEEVKSALPEEQKTGSAEYSARLEKCRQCDHLNSGTCTKCGCYVEYRALKKAMHCPHEQSRW